jgi:nitrogen regulatory protein P-II 1
MSMLDRIRPDKPRSAVTDPVSGMQVAADSEHRHTYEGNEYLFCSAACRDKFVASPGKYLQTESTGSAEAMEYRKVIAIIRSDRLENVEQALQALAVPGVSASKVKGYGEYRDFYERDWMIGHVRIEIFTPQSRATAIAEAIMEASHTGLPGDGIVAIQPVETLFHIESRSVVTGEKENVKS